eukprot:4273337-Amphidinium_carterae.2
MPVKAGIQLCASALPQMVDGRAIFRVGQAAILCHILHVACGISSRLVERMARLAESYVSHIGQACCALPA